MCKIYLSILFLVMAAAAVIWPVYVADQFFLALWPSLLWAVAIGWSSALRGWRGGLVTLFLALVPTAMATIYFGMAHASDESFLLAGVIPWSDAGAHFVQAAEMATRGMTYLGMNGRFLYPAYFSSLLNLTNCNLLVAEALGGCLFATALTLALREVSHCIGFFGSMIVALVCELFFRERCAGLIMTENLGILCGLLSLSALLVATRRQSVWLLLLGIFMLALGFCARPGALVVLPFLVLFAGWVGWNGWLQAPFHRIFKALLVATLALLVTLMAFGCNMFLSRTLYTGKVTINGNFAFTLYGVLTGGKWSDCLGWSHGDSQLVMQESLTLIQKKPQLLLFGAARAYKSALYRRILFMFNHESRPATLLLIMAGLGLVTLWKKEELKPYASWMTLIAAGILLSIPFVPPWDAAERPFAATVPFQGLLAGIGFFALLQHLFSKKFDIVSKKSDANSCDYFFVLLLSLIVFFLTVPFPLLHQRWMKPVVNVDTHSSIALRAGSFFTLSPEQQPAFQRHLKPFLDHYPEESCFFSTFPKKVILGIDWNSKNFDRTLLLDPVGETVPFRGWQVDKRLLPQN